MTLIPCCWSIEPVACLLFSIFRKPYYVGHFLPTLLQPRPVWAPHSLLSLLQVVHVLFTTRWCLHVAYWWCNGQGIGWNVIVRLPVQLTEILPLFNNSGCCCVRWSYTLLQGSRLSYWSTGCWWCLAGGKLTMDLIERNSSLLYHLWVNCLVTIHVQRYIRIA